MQHPKLKTPGEIYFFHTQYEKVKQQYYNGLRIRHLLLREQNGIEIKCRNHHQMKQFLKKLQIIILRDSSRYIISRNVISNDDIVTLLCESILSIQQQDVPERMKNFNPNMKQGCTYRGGSAEKCFCCSIFVEILQRMSQSPEKCHEKNFGHKMALFYCAF